MEFDTMNRHPDNTTMIRRISLFSATNLVVANMIGTGIFTTSGFIMAELKSPMLMLACWVVGGLFALCGALCYGELGARMPRAGGEYVFLKESLGQCMGFLSGWISLIVGFSAPIAAASIAFAAYLFQAFDLAPGSGLDLSFGGITFFTLSPVAMTGAGTVTALSLIHYLGVAAGTRVQNALTLFKISIVVAFIAAGLSVGKGSVAHFGGGLEITALFREPFAVSLVFVSFAYSGWNAAAYLGGEITNPERNIPLALLLGTMVVTGLYALLNVVFIYALSPEDMSGVLEVGARSAAALFGERIGRCFNGAIALGLLSVMSAMIMTGPRVYYAMSADGVFFRVFGKIHKRRHTPASSIFLQAGVAVFMVITASFEKLLVYIGFTLSFSAMLTVAGLIRIRMKGTASDIRYRTPGYPVTPLLFIMGNLWIVYFCIRSRPMATLAGLGTIALGLVVYICFAKQRRRN